MPYFNLIKLDAIDSTNEELKRRHHLGLASSKDLIWAESQSKGKGQRNASWDSEPYKNLTFSIYQALPKGFVFDLMQANANITLAVHTALKAFYIPSLRIKWPNDILSGNKKIAGVLIETIFRGSECVAMIIGLGINVNQTNFQGLERASSMAVLAGNEFSRAEVLSAVQKALAEAIEDQTPKDQLLQQYNDLLFKKDIPTSFRVGDHVFTGCLRGVTPEGKLLVENEESEFSTYAIKEVELLY